MLLCSNELFVVLASLLLTNKSIQLPVRQANLWWRTPLVHLVLNFMELVPPKCSRIGSLFRAREHRCGVKTNAGQGSFYRSQHEFVFVYKSGEGPHLNNIELGRHGRNRSNVWTYPGERLPRGTPG
jgi:hypothetical protein